jgi:hypothetical protein
MTGRLLAAAEPQERASVIMVVGAGGESNYADTFARWTTEWQTACAIADAKTTTIKADDKDALLHLRQALEAEPKETPTALWLVLLGHGSFDSRDGKFNLAGDDLAASELAAWLKPFHRPVIIICGFSASGAFLKPLSAPDRILIAATKSGAENNYARLGGYLAETIADPSADLDKDGQTSLLEAWLAAAQRTAGFYQNADRLATEHSLLDDNGDGFGTPPDWFQGVRAVKQSSDHRAPDGFRAHQLYLVPSAAEKALPLAVRTERDALERELAQLREVKAAMPEEVYYTQLEALLVRLAHVYQQAKTPPPE